MVHRLTQFVIKNKGHKKTVKIIDFNSSFKHRIDLVSFVRLVIRPSFDHQLAGKSYDHP